MTLLDPPKAMPNADEAQLLFEEARDRRRRRWILSGIVAAVVVVILAVTLGAVLETSGGGTPKPAARPTTVPAIARTAYTISFRPVLCYAPALTLAAGQSAKEGPLPNCTPTSALTATNLNDNTSIGQATTTPPPDAQFSSYASTPPNKGETGDTVLLPGAPGQGASRFVLGPAGLTQQGIVSAQAVHLDGGWAVNFTLSAAGATEWDTLAQQQFHALIAVVINHRVISAPITQPMQTAFSSFDGDIEISAGFNERQARAIASSL